MNTCRQSDKKIRGNLVYQQRQQRRRSYLEKKQLLRRTFELGKLIEKVGFKGEEMMVIYGLLLEAKEKLSSQEAKTIRECWRMKGNQTHIRLSPLFKVSIF